MLLRWRVALLKASNFSQYLPSSDGPSWRIRFPFSYRKTGRHVGWFVNCLSDLLGCHTLGIIRGWRPFGERCSHHQGEGFPPSRRAGAQRPEDRRCGREPGALWTPKLCTLNNVFLSDGAIKEISAVGRDVSPTTSTPHPVCYRLDKYTRNDRSQSLLTLTSQLDVIFTRSEPSSDSRLLSSSTVFRKN